MSKIQAKLKAYARKEGIDTKQWDKPLPHFGGHAPHRMQGFAYEYIGGKSRLKVCVYCLKPETK